MLDKHVFSHERSVKHPFHLFKTTNVFLNKKSGMEWTWLSSACIVECRSFSTRFSLAKPTFLRYFCYTHFNKKLSYWVMKSLTEYGRWNYQIHPVYNYNVSNDYDSWIYILSLFWSNNNRGNTLLKIVCTFKHIGLFFIFLKAVISEIFSVLLFVCCPF